MFRTAATGRYTRDGRRRGSAIRLDKWYLDLTTPRGAALIGYWARLSILGLPITWSSRLAIGTEGVDVASSLARTPSPAGDGFIHWHHPKLSVEGTWTPRRPAYATRLWESAAGEVHWNCVCPSADARLTTDDATWAGLGYAERLTVTVEPWKLPIRDLYWGRFLAEEADVVWIRWVGPHPLSLVLVDGRPADTGRVEPNAVETAEASLTLEERRTIRDGRLGPTVLRTVPGLRRVAPETIRDAHERKWLSRGVLRRPGAGSVSGWAIHEQVSFTPEPTP